MLDYLLMNKTKTFYFKTIFKNLKIKNKEFNIKLS